MKTRGAVMAAVCKKFMETSLESRIIFDPNVREHTNGQRTYQKILKI
jgi:hypothetical protein